MRHPTLNQLLRGPTPVQTVGPSSMFVNPRHNLPGLIRYGSQQPQHTVGAGYTGGQVAHPISSPVHPPAPSTPAGPMTAHSGVAASLAALGLLTPTPHGGPAAPTMAPPPPITQTGATPPPPPRTQPLTTLVGQVQKPTGFTPPYTPSAPQPIPTGGPVANYDGNPQSVLDLLTRLATMGRKATNFQLSRVQ
jgi:hypothetical protein